jgi:SAM-dependent methyltransferase
MATSTNYFKQEIKNYVLNNFDKNSKILDIGAGSGTYSNLLSPEGYKNIDAVEIYEKHIEGYNLEQKYNQVFRGNVCDLGINFSNYDLIILGDVLEYIDKREAKKLIEKIGNVPTIISVSLESEQNKEYENEKRLQLDITLDIFLERFDSYNPFCLRFDYGVFINKENKIVYTETGEKDLPEQYLKKLKMINSESKIQNIEEIPQEKPSIEKKANKTTIVTGLWNLGRANISESLSRKYEDYLKTFSKLMETDVNMYIFCDPSDEDFIWQHRNKENTVVNKMSLNDLLSWFEFTNLTNQIRTNETWLSQSGWLRESPQATLEGYNPLVMSKMFMLNNVTIWNPFNSENFFWIDAGITNTVHYGYFTHDNVFDNLSNFLDINCDFMFISYPYVGGTEIHGFDRDAIAKYSQTGYVDYVCRGGFFGGKKEKINEVNGKYYWYLSKSLNEGFMGTEESVFTILSHLDDSIYRFEIQDNGLIWPFFEELKKYKNVILSKNEPPTPEPDPSFLLDKVFEVKPITSRKNQEETALYVIGFNSPNQFKTLIHSMMFYDKSFIDKTKKYLLNNSTDLSTTEQYEALCKSYGFEHVKKDNLGITGGRQWIADHFNESGHKYCMFFEDDMFFHSDRVGYCRNGFNRYVPNLYDKVLSIMKKERFDFLKFNFSEFFGDNGTQWSWYNVPQVVREAEFPEKTKLPTQGLDPDAPRTEFKNIRSVDGLSYITGDIYYSNWPQIMSKEGNKKCFIDTKFQFPYEQTIMSFIFQETKKGVIKPGILLLTPTEHNRFDHYDASLRKEC